MDHTPHSSNMDAFGTSAFMSKAMQGKNQQGFMNTQVKPVTIYLLSY
jgi:hypothetical protein